MRCWPEGPGLAGHPLACDTRWPPAPQVLYQKSMQALSLLLQTFISENKSMDEVCFVLQVRVGAVWAQSRGLRAPTQVLALDSPGSTQGGCQVGSLVLHPDPSVLGPLTSPRGTAGCFRRAKAPARRRVVR